MSKDIEIEIKVKVEKIASLLKFLTSQAKLVGTQHQIDEYFIPKHRDFIAIRPAKEWLRLRNSDGKYSLNYKNWHYQPDGKTHHCDEFETHIDDLSSLQNIFKALDIKSIAIVDKSRQIWLYQDFEIAIDKVKKLGHFIEIEYKGFDSKTDPKIVTNRMVQFLKDHGCGTISRNFQGYPFLLLFPTEAKYENQ
jgi:predicted adenylyl cyclase CyaB